MSIITGNNVMGIFDDQGQAHQAVIELRLAGFRDNDMGIIASRSQRRESSAMESAIPVVPENGGQSLGAESLGLLSLAPLTLPAVGPVVVGGFLTTLAGNATGGTLAGGLVCSLMGMGVPESHAREMERALLFSCTIVSVHTDLRQSEAGMILDWDGAQHALGEIDRWAGAVPRDRVELSIAKEPASHIDCHLDNPYRSRMAG